MAEGGFCTKCGKPLAPDARFCVHCGAPRPSAPIAPTPAPETEPISTPVTGETGETPTIEIAAAAPGAVFAPSPPRPEPPTPAAGSDRVVPVDTRPEQPGDDRRRVWVIGGVVVLLIAGAIGAFALTRGGGGEEKAADPPKTTHTTATTRRRTTTTTFLRETIPDRVLEPTAVVASSVRPATSDACTPPNPTSFDASNVADGRPDSAWMPDPSDTSPSVTLSFDDPIRVSALQLVNGYPKQDPCRADLNRFYQFMRPTLISVDLHDGSASQQLSVTDTPTQQTLDVVGTTDQITLTILESNPPDTSRIQTGTQIPFTIPAIGEITVKGSN